MSSTWRVWSESWSDSATAASETSHEGGVCNMNMLFTWETNSICIVFQWWRIYNKVTLAFSFLGIIGLGIGYEFLREMTRRFEVYIAKPDRQDYLLPLIVKKYVPNRSIRDRVVLSFFYALQVLYSFFLMLVFMSYNGLMMLAVVIGAFIGFFFFGSRTRIPAAYGDDDDQDIITDINDELINSKTSVVKIMSRPVGTSAVRGGTCH
ncbi:Ctr copper transporter family-domain-containing protein [Lipomyces kononenkoae]|uniref:Ctr copper transporter family-domain-containing protein n=1 Tax=Lipomyces kononenkoae TaxID=34357 RepID=A0ACC3TB71_LIPKO